MQDNLVFERRRGWSCGTKWRYRCFQVLFLFLPDNYIILRSSWILEIVLKVLLVRHCLKGWNRHMFLVLWHDGLWHFWHFFILYRLLLKGSLSRHYDVSPFLFAIQSCLSYHHLWLLLRHAISTAIFVVGSGNRCLFIVRSSSAICYTNFTQTCVAIVIFYRSPTRWGLNHPSYLLTWWCPAFHWFSNFLTLSGRHVSYSNRILLKLIFQLYRLHHQLLLLLLLNSLCVGSDEVQNILSKQSLIGCNIIIGLGRLWLSQASETIGFYHVSCVGFIFHQFAIILISAIYFYSVIGITRSLFLPPRNNDKLFDVFFEFGPLL